MELAVYLGVSQGFVSQMEKGVSPVPDWVLDKVTSNPNWRMSVISADCVTDEEMESAEFQFKFKSHYIPVLPVSARGGSLSDYSIAVSPSDCEYAVSPIAGADMIIPVSGESMAPEYPNGSRIVVKQINDKAFIEWGKVYVLDTINGPVLKELHKCSSDEEVECVSLNPNPKYASFNVKRSDIIGMYRVLMVMALK